MYAHGIIVAFKETRLKEPLDLHFERKRKLYVRGKSYRLHVEPITSEAAFVTDYCGNLP